MVSRIPASLQAVFMASNQGQEVHVAPKDNSAYRVYRRQKGMSEPKPVFAKYATASYKRVFASVSCVLFDIAHLTLILKGA